MQMTESMRLVERYLDALAARDLDAVRGLLSNEGFHYISPIAQFDDPDDFVASMEGVGAILHKVKIIHRFADGELVCHVVDITVSLETYRTRRIVQLARVQADKIVDLEVIFDASEFNRMIVPAD